MNNNNRAVSIINANDDDFSVLISNQVRLDLSEGKTIQPTSLLELSKKIIEYIENGGEKQLPKEFYALTERIDNYWSYRRNPDIERDLSYARVYQIISFFKIWEHLRQSEDDLIRVTSQYTANDINLLHIVNQNPGIIHKDLAKLLKHSKSSLSQNAPKLESKGFLHSQRFGAKKYYHLSYTGERLLERLERIARNNEHTRKTTTVYMEHSNNEIKTRFSQHYLTYSKESDFYYVRTEIFKTEISIEKKPSYKEASYETPIFPDYLHELATKKRV